MSASFLEQDYFEALKKFAFQQLETGDHLFLSLNAESSQFLRINAAKVRQTGQVEDAELNLIFIHESKGRELRKSSRSFSLTNDGAADQTRIKLLISELKAEALSLPADPYAELPKKFASSSQEKRGELLPPNEAAGTLLSGLQNYDLVGLYASGPVVRAFSHSAGLTHWFKTESFLFDYSIYAENQKAIKSLIGGQVWDFARYQKQIEENADQLEKLRQPPKKLNPGNYRVYLAPDAVSDLIGMFSWGCVSEASIQQGDSPLRKLRSKEKTFSEIFSLDDDFRDGGVPRWSEEGELAPEILEVIHEGQLKNSLVSSRTAREYKRPSNAALTSEALRSPVMRPGHLQENHILKELQNGIYISNLHYLNWSDQSEGRITGMTRYACFWVERGEIQSPVENMRFDDNIFSLFGTNLEALTQSLSWIPDLRTYGMRSLGAMNIPGILISEMRFTL